MNGLVLLYYCIIVLLILLYYLYYCITVLLVLQYYLYYTITCITCITVLLVLLYYLYYYITCITALLYYLYYCITCITVLLVYYCITVLFVLLYYCISYITVLLFLLKIWKSITHSLTHSLTTSNQEMLAHLKIRVNIFDQISLGKFVKWKRKFERKKNKIIFHGKPILLGLVSSCENPPKCQRWHILLNLATRGCPWVKFKFKYASTLSEGHLSQRWRIWDLMEPHNNFFQKKYICLNPTTLPGKLKIKKKESTYILVCHERLRVQFIRTL